MQTSDIWLGEPGPIELIATTKNVYVAHGWSLMEADNSMGGWASSTGAATLAASVT